MQTLPKILLSVAAQKLDRLPEIICEARSDAPRSVYWEITFGNHSHFAADRGEAVPPSVARLLKNMFTRWPS